MQPRIVGYKNDVIREPLMKKQKPLKRKPESFLHVHKIDQKPIVTKKSGLTTLITAVAAINLRLKHPKRDAGGSFTLRPSTQLGNRLRLRFKCRQ